MSIFTTRFSCGMVKRKGVRAVRISAKCSIAVHCLLFLHEYGGTQKITSGLLALSTGCNPVMIRSIMSAMKKAGIIQVTAGRGGAVLVLPPEEITLYRVYTAVEGDGLRDLIGVHSMPSALCPIGRNIRAVLQKPYAAVQEDMRKSLQSVTLADFIAEYRKTGSGPV